VLRETEPFSFSGIPCSLLCAIALLTSPCTYGDSTRQVRTLCISGATTREIVVRIGDAASGASTGCHVDYTKDGATSELWSARNDESLCTRNAEQLKRKLSGAGFSCMTVSAVGRAQTVLPGGILLRPVQKEDLQLVRSLCPAAQWRDTVFTCSRSEWASWAKTLEIAQIPGERLDAFRSFVSGHGFIEKPTDGVLIFPDLSTHLLIDGFSSSSGEVAAWLIDPEKRGIDLIWLTGGTPVYLGPNAEFLRSHALDTDSFKIESWPTPSG
jgi:hypothetical protein